MGVVQGEILKEEGKMDLLVIEGPYRILTQLKILVY
jgi:hypothetical protein